MNINENMFCKPKRPNTLDLPARSNRLGSLTETPEFVTLQSDSNTLTPIITPTNSDIEDNFVLDANGNHPIKQNSSANNNKIISEIENIPEKDNEQFSRSSSVSGRLTEIKKVGKNSLKDEDLFREVYTDLKKEGVLMSEEEKSLITEEVVALIRDDPSIDKTFIAEFIVK